MKNQDMLLLYVRKKKLNNIKRFIFGVNSAPEELQQHMLQTILANIDGVMNIADDILIYGITVEQHDKAVADILERLTQKGLTLKLPKCIFDQPTVDYYRYSFLNEGIRPTTLTINAFNEAKRPCDAKGVKSFLGLANYLKRFNDDYNTITYLLRLLSQNTHLKQDEKCEAAFQNLNPLMPGGNKRSHILKQTCLSE